MKSDPDFSGRANNTDGGEDGFESGLLAFALLTFNFLSSGLRGGESLNFSELNGLGGVSVAVVLANGRLRGVDKRIVDVPARISCEVASIEITIEVLAAGDLFQFTEIANVSAVFIENQNEVRVVQRGDGHFAIRQPSY